MAQGVPINYGTCVRGPYNAKHMAHHTAIFRVVTDKTDPRRGQQLLDPDEKVAHGVYHFGAKSWLWHDGKCDLGPDSECRKKATFPQPES